MNLDANDEEFRFPPDWGSPIFSWARPRFEAVFILLHPFIRVPKELESFLEPNEWRWFAPGGFEKLMELGAQHVSWAEVMVALGVADYSTMVDVIQAFAIGFPPVAADYRLTELLELYLSESKILSPTTHYLPRTLIPLIRSSIKEFGQGDPLWSESPYECGNLLYATPYECAYSLICSSEATLKAIVQKYRFEGFYADGDTNFDWKKGSIFKPGEATGAMEWRAERRKEKE